MKLFLFCFISDTVFSLSTINQFVGLHGFMHFWRKNNGKTVFCFYCRLEELKIENNSLIHLPNTLKSLRNLKSLQVANNKIVKLPDFMQIMRFNNGAVSLLGIFLLFKGILKKNRYRSIRCKVNSKMGRSPSKQMIQIIPGWIWCHLWQSSIWRETNWREISFWEIFR